MVQGEPDDDFDEEPFRQPLPLDDRVWRHPSELDSAPRRIRLPWMWLRKPEKAEGD